MTVMESTAVLARVSSEWADTDVSLYLSRCQIDTPRDLVATTWQLIHEKKEEIGTVIDFGAGDARFARGGRYCSYVGYEIDESRLPSEPLPQNASVSHSCAFSAPVGNADLCIGNPPFVRNQDLPEGWRSQVAERLTARTGLKLSGLANAWQYFFLLSLVSTHEEGLCALVVPYEWVSRPSVEALRTYIRDQGWGVDVHRLSDHSFDTVLTTASITIIDKSRKDGLWRFFEMSEDGQSRPISSTSGSEEGHLAYSRRTRVSGTPRATRGLSPGTQKVFVLTEPERARLGLKPDRDVVRCVTSLKHLPAGHRTLDAAAFDRFYRSAGVRCWLINPISADMDGPLKAYLDTVDPAHYATATCLERPIWWKFKMPEIPAAFVATCFKNDAPKSVLNSVGAFAVGGVAGIHGVENTWAGDFIEALAGLQLKGRIVAHANKLMKIEIGQLNTLLAEFQAQGARG